MPSDAVCHRSGHASTGGLIRDHHGFWITGFSKNIDHCSVIMTELWGALEGFQIAWNIGLKQLILEMNSIDAIQVIQGNGGEQHYSIVA